LLNQITIPPWKPKPIREPPPSSPKKSTASLKAGAGLERAAMSMKAKREEREAKDGKKTLKRCIYASRFSVFRFSGFRFSLFPVFCIYATQFCGFPEKTGKPDFFLYLRTKLFRFCLIKTLTNFFPENRKILSRKN
jgi:hypothetical protein